MLAKIVNMIAKIVNMITKIVNVQFFRCWFLIRIDREKLTLCDCPSGYILCNWLEVQTQSGGAKDWSFAKELCDPLKFENRTAVFVDYNNQMVCDTFGNTDYPQTSDSSFLLSKLSFLTSFSSTIFSGTRKCEIFNHFLCKKSDVYSVDCHLGKPTKWTKCVNGKQKRYQAVIHSGQHGGKKCSLLGSWDDESHVLTETRSC
eukprot:GHVP01060850.1.p1 GENE.GHVP01060850.1~~GHVP01060850.1.p1  ORF type:complete len:202 (+),score=20.15 GHVP01060850.1:766-1371(+)